MTALIQRKADPSVAVSLGRATGIPFGFPAVVAAGRSVIMSGRIGVKGRISTPGGTLPKKTADAVALLKKEAADSIAAAVPAVSDSAVSADVGGLPLRAGVTDQGSATAALSQLPLKVTELTFGSVKAKGSADVDLLVEIGPSPKKDAKSTSEGSSSALGSASFGTAEAVLTDRYEGEGQKQRLAAARNTVAVPAEHLKYADRAAALLSAKFEEMLDDLNLKAKKHGKTDPGEDLRESLGTKYDVIRWLNFMRPWFGSDDKTLEHFSGIRQVKGQSNLLLHDRAATRLEAVQDKLGKDNFPQSTVGWSFRGEMQLGASQAHKHMHKIGWAVDFDAYNLPMQSNAMSRYLVKLVTGREQRLAPKDDKHDWRDYATRRKLIRDIEKGIEPGSARDKERTAFLDALGTEVDSLAAASEAFKNSLGPGGATKLNELRAKWREAQEGTDPVATAAAKAEIQKELSVVLKPWLDKIDAERAALQAKAQQEHGVDLSAAAPDPKEADSLAAGAKAAKASLAKLKKGKALSPKETEALSALAAKVLTAPAGDLTPDGVQILIDAAAAKVIAVNDAVKRDKAAGGLRKAHVLASGLRSSLLEDFTYLFGTAQKGKGGKEGKEDLAVTDPSAAQMLNRGYFRVAAPDAPSADKKRMISKAFVLEMVQHGFEIGGGWESADSMHFEVAAGKSPAAQDD